MRNKVDVALELLEDVFPAGENGTYYYGQEYGEMKCRESTAEKIRKLKQDISNCKRILWST